MAAAGDIGRAGSAYYGFAEDHTAQTDFACCDRLSTVAYSSPAKRRAAGMVWLEPREVGSRLDPEDSLAYFVALAGPAADPAVEAADSVPAAGLAHLHRGTLSKPRPWPL